MVIYSFEWEYGDLGSGRYEKSNNIDYHDYKDYSGFRFVDGTAAESKISFAID